MQNNTNTVIFDTEQNLYLNQNKQGYTAINSPELGYFTQEEAQKVISDTQKQIALNAYCFDFLSSDPERSGGYVMVFAENLNLARDAMFKKHGDKWGTSYTKSQFFNNFPSFMYLYDVIEPVFENEIEK